MDQIIQDFGNSKALGLKKPVKQVQSRLGMAEQMGKPFGVLAHLIITKTATLSTVSSVLSIYVFLFPIIFFSMKYPHG